MKVANLILVGTAIATSSAFAASAHPDVTAKLPAEMVQGEVRYVSGGIGHKEALAFRSAEHRYSLGLEFADKAKRRDEFTADVKVVIRDAKGKTVLDAVSYGPFLLARLPAGRYDIKATEGTTTIERHATVVQGKPTHVGFLWRSS